MSQNAASNINQILTSFDTFVKILEDHKWPRSAKVEDIKTAFKLGCFIEKSMEHFESLSSTKEFLDILSKWWQEKKRTKLFGASFYVMACDELLMRFFRCENISESGLDVAVRVYTSIFPRERMERVISKLILTAGSSEAISEFIKVSCDEQAVGDLEYRLKLQNWCNLLEAGNKSCVEEEIKEMLVVYKVDTYLQLLIGVLTFSDVSEGERLVQNLVLGGVLEKMSDRSILSKQFWRTLFKVVDVRLVSSASANFKDFLVSLFNFIVYLGSMMQKVGDLWKNDPDVSLCPDIGYTDILVHIQDVCSVGADTKTFVVDRLCQTKEFTNSKLWEDIIEEIS